MKTLHEEHLDNKHELIRIKLVGPESYSDVMSISGDIYGGKDYIPSTYKLLVAKSNVYSFLLTLDGNPVSFCIIMVLEHDTSALRCALRTHAQYRGRGFMAKLLHHAELYVKCECLHLREFIDIGITTPGHVDDDAHIALRWMWAECEVMPFSDEFPQTSLHDGPNPTHLRPSDCERIFSDKRNLAVFTGNRFVCLQPWAPVTVTMNNIVRVAAQDFVLATQENELVTSISFSATCDVPVGTSCNVFYYGELSPTRLVQHTYISLRHHGWSKDSDEIGPKRFCTVHFPDGIDMDEFKSRVNGMLRVTHHGHLQVKIETL